jgi:ribonuclease VapC
MPFSRHDGLKQTAEAKIAKIVFDASAVIALIREEPGAEIVENYLGNALISTVNFQEVIVALMARGLPTDQINRLIKALHLDVAIHDAEDAEMAASLYPYTSPYGCGLGDRACLALGLRKSLPVLTTDQIWSKLAIPKLNVLLARVGPHQ